MMANDYNDLLKKFWAGNATGPEKLQLYKHIMEQEEGLRVLPDLDGNEIGDNLTPEDSQRILEALHQEMKPATPSRGKTVRLFRWAAAVAAVLVSILVARWALQKQAPERTANRVAAVSSERTIYNNQSAVMQVQLADSSLVSIYPGSSISYADSFNTGSERLIQLKGKANFKVQHNAFKPFQVVARQIKTTDIGTEFLIDAQQSNIVKVKLTAGSIRVETLPNSNMAMVRKMQRPGEELNINLATREITAAEPFRSPAPEEAPASAARHITPMKTRLSFNKTPLAEVFAKLARREQVKISFDRTVVDGLTFTGNIEPKDPLPLSLNILCGLNGLEYTTTENGIIITKKK
jgi:ferric-dicitrate binding protein FerR (iron transport regulator)